MCGNERASGYETSIVSYSDGFLPSQSILGALLGTLVRRRENACRVFHLNRFIKTDEQSRLLCARELYWSGSEFKVSPVVQSSDYKQPERRACGYPTYHRPKHYFNVYTGSLVQMVWASSKYNLLSFKPRRSHCGLIMAFVV